MNKYSSTLIYTYPGTGKAQPQAQTIIYYSTTCREAHTAYHMQHYFSHLTQRPFSNGNLKPKRSNRKHIVRMLFSIVPSLQISWEMVVGLLVDLYWSSSTGLGMHRDWSALSFIFAGSLSQLPWLDEKNPWGGGGSWVLFILPSQQDSVGVENIAKDGLARRDF